MPVIRLEKDGVSKRVRVSRVPQSESEVNEIWGAIGESAAPVQTQQPKPQPITTPLTSNTVEQREGPVPSKAGLRSLIPEKEQLPEMIGSAVGSIATGGVPGVKGTLTSAVGSGAGAVAGEAALQLGQRAGVFKGEPPASSEEALGRMGGAFARGAGSEVIGRGAAKLFTPFRGSFTPEIKKGMEAAERIGVKPALRNVTESRFLQASERGSEFFPVVGERITKAVAKSIDDFGNFAKSVGNNLGANRPPEVLGNLAKEATSAFFDRFQQSKNALYNAVMPNVSKLEPSLNNTINQLQKIIEIRSGIGGEQAVSTASKYLERVLGKKVPSGIVDSNGKEILKKISSEVKTFGDLLNFKRNISDGLKFSDPSITGFKGDLEDLVLAMTKDLDDTAMKASPELAEKFRAANQHFSNGIEILKDKVYKSLVNVDPVNVHKVVIPVTDSPTTIRLGKEILGDDFKLAVGQWFDDIIRKSSSIVDGEDIVSPQKLVRNLKRYRNSLPEIFSESPEIVKNLEDLVETGKLLTRGQKVTMGSQTAFNQQAFASIAGTFAAIAAFVTNPTLAAQIMGTAAGAGTFGALSGTAVGRKLLTSGYPKIGRAFGQVVRTAAQVAMQPQVKEVQK